MESHKNFNLILQVDPHLMTIATLTGHCVLAYGESYSSIMDNGPARMAGVAHFMQICGDQLADPFEVSSLFKLWICSF